TTVDFGSTPATSVSCSSTTSCSGTTPAGPSGGGSVNVTVTTSDGTSNAVTYTYYAVYISSITPSNPGILTQVTVTGSGFGSSQGSGYVSFNDTTNSISWGVPGDGAYFEVISWSSTSVVFQVPSDSGWWNGQYWDPSPGDSINITITNSSNITSNTVPITIGSPTTYSYSSYGSTEYIGPDSNYAASGTISSGSSVSIICQGTGLAVSDTSSPSGTSDIWDFLNTGYWVSDTTLSTPGSNQFSSGIPQCTGFTMNPYAQNSAGFDINQFSTSAPTCSTSTLPTTPYAPNLVQVDGGPESYYNGCLVTEANYDTGSTGPDTPPLELIMFPGAGQDASGPPICGGNQWCNHGYNVAANTYNYVVSQLSGGTPKTWLLDVECGGGSGWYGCSDSSGSTGYADNIESLTGALYFFIYNSMYVGIYSSPGEWSNITGNWSTVTTTSGLFVVGNWLAEYGPNASPYPTSCNGSSANTYLSNTAGAQPFSGGPLWMWQYASTVPSGSSTFDGDLSCYQS
ncbi:MAG: IPT/TIG domain-containing protein, partial [Actinobacteria bacterium]|nr:IPT/TIG domain-containing protein [Actinomycetota bacterium]